MPVSKLKLMILFLMVHILALAAICQEPNSPTLRFVCNKNIPPIVFLQNGKPEGLMVDLVNAVAQEAGISIIIEPMNWSKAQELVKNGKADAVLRVNITPEREKFYDFSIPLIDSSFHIFRKNTRMEIRDLASLNGKTVGVEGGGFTIQYLKQFPQINVVEVDNWKTGFQMLQTEKLDAIVVDRWVGEYALYTNKIKDVMVVSPPIVKDFSRIAVKKGNTKLLEQINMGLRKIRKDGTRQMILKKWRASEVVYITKESVDRIVLGGAIGCTAILIVITLRALTHYRTIKKINRELVGEIQQRKQAETALIHANNNLEQRVNERTADLQSANEKLGIVNQRYELIMSGAEAGIWDWDVPGRKMMYSQQWKAMRGFDENEISDREEEWSDRIHPEDAPRVIESVKKHFMGKTLFFSEEYRVLHKKGHWIWIANRGIAQRNATGQVIRMAGSETDITERKRAEDALRENEQKLRLALLASDMGTFEIDLVTGTTHWNQKEYELFGVKPGDVPDSTESFFRFVHPDDLNMLQSQWQNALKIGNLDTEFRIIRLDGSIRKLSARGQFTFDRGLPVHFTGVNFDITENNSL